MEDNKNRNYDQENRDYNDAPSTTDFEKSKLNDDPNQAYQKNPEQFEEFSNDHPNSDNLEGNSWKDNNLNRDINNSSDNSKPIDPDDDFEGDSIIDDEVREPELDDKSVDDEDNFDESNIDDDEDDNDDEINNENSDLDDDWLNRNN